MEPETMFTNKVKIILEKGEGISVEFKKATNQLPSNLFETIAAILNRNGGEILLGIDDDKSVIGINNRVVDQFCKQISNTSNNPQLFYPTFLINAQTIEYQNKKLKYSKNYSGSDKIVFREEDIFVSTVPLHPQENIGGLNGGLNNPQKKVLSKIKDSPGLNIANLADKMNIPYKTMEKHIAFLINNNWIERRGSKKTGGYHIK